MSAAVRRDISPLLQKMRTFLLGVSLDRRNILLFCNVFNNII